MSTEKGEANPADKANTPTTSTRDDRTTEGTGTNNLQLWFLGDGSEMVQQNRELHCHYCEMHRQSREMEDAFQAGLIEMIEEIHRLIEIIEELLETTIDY